MVGAAGAMVVVVVVVVVVGVGVVVVVGVGVVGGGSDVPRQRCSCCECAAAVTHATHSPTHPTAPFPSLPPSSPRSLTSRNGSVVASVRPTRSRIELGATSDAPDTIRAPGKPGLISSSRILNGLGSVMVVHTRGSLLVPLARVAVAVASMATAPRRTTSGGRVVTAGTAALGELTKPVEGTVKPATSMTSTRSAVMGVGGGGVVEGGGGS